MRKGEANDRRGCVYTFPCTEWTVVLQAGELSQPALARLCEKYRPALLAHLLARQVDPADAEDLVQGFLTDLCRPGPLDRVGPEKGRFRTWLLRSFANYVCSQARQRMAQKRGGGRSLETLDTVTGEHAPGHAAADPGRSPDQAYDRAWAETLVAAALRRLKDEATLQGKAHAYELIEPVLYRDGEAASYREIGLQLHCSESGARSAASRLRGRLRALIWDEVARVVSDPALVEEELAYLTRLMGR